MIRPGISYRSVHLKASEILAERLKDMGLMRGSASAAVAAGAHALFFPHGLGHMMGLDVHDMEDLGETYVGYDDRSKRSTQFGLAYLRLAKKLEPGYVLTVEPGIYFIPALIDQWRAEKKHAAFINYAEVENFRSFGGIRIEDNVLVTPRGGRVLGPPIAKEIAAVEAAVRGV
jgi:Xaa-Pro aminopeptidase